MDQYHRDIGKSKLKEAALGRISKTNADIGAIVIGGDYQGLGIVRNLAEHGIPIRIMDYEPSIGRFSRYVQKSYRCPVADDELSFVEYLVAVADKDGLHKWVVYPTSDKVAVLLSKHKDFLARFFKIWTPGWRTMSEVYDKRLTKHLADRVGVAYPKTITYPSLDEIGGSDIRFPVIIKPAFKNAFFDLTKKKALAVWNKKELIENFYEISQVVDPEELMIQELIPGSSNHQYSYCALFKNGEPKARLMARRARQHPMDFGQASTFVETVRVPELEDYSIRLLRELDYYGMCEVEYKYDARDKEFKFLEINARSWGWHSLGRRAGVNFSYLLFLDQIGEEHFVEDYRIGIKWLRSMTDFPTFLKEWTGGRMRAIDYVKSLRGEKELAVFSLRDPLPFFVEIAMAPYLRKKRGF
jgi:predicted ATP-grasp superfamily ATP-dependent carboligase